MENISIISKTFPEWQASCRFFLIHRNKSDLAFFKKRNTRQLLSNTNDNGDNNKKTKCLKTWVGIFRMGIFWVAVFRGNPRAGNLTGGIFRVLISWGDSPDTIFMVRK